MPAVAGVLAQTAFYDDFSGVVSSNVRAADDPYTPDAYRSPLDALTGAAAPTLAEALPSTVSSLVGLSGSGFDTFYFRIVIEPARLDLGNLVTDQVRQVIVWNGYLSSKPMSAMASSGFDGIAVSGPTAPLTMAPTQELTYTFNVSLDGPPQIEATFAWVIDGQSYILPITGSRVNLWPFPPTWSYPVLESLEWKSRVGRAYDGTEQRASLRHQARRRLNYTFSVMRDETQRFDNLTWGWQNRPFAVPFWQYKRELTGPVTAGDATVPVDTSDVGFAASNLAVIYESPSSFEVVEIDSVASNQLALARPAQGTWPAGTAIYPASVSAVEGNIAATRLTDNTLTGSVRFLSHPSTVDPFTPTAAAPATYNGYELLLEKPNWSGGLSADREYKTAMYDNPIGVINWTVTEQTPILTRAYRWLLKSRAEVRAFREFLQRRKGMFNACYIPTWHRDFTLLEPIGASDTSMIVSDYQYAKMVGGDPAKGHLYIRGRDGLNYARPISGVTQGVGSVTISFATALGKSYTPADLLAIHSLMLWRLASDEVQINWLTDEVATVEAVFQVVKA